MAKNIFLSRPLPEAGMELLKQSEFNVDIHWDEEPLSRETMLKRAQKAHGLICLLSDIIDPAFMDAAPHLEVISNYAVGYNNIDIDHAKSKGIAVCNTPGVLTITTAELAWALLFAVARRIPESDIFMRNGKFTGWKPMLMLGSSIHGKTLGIIGAGQIGTAFALMSKGYNMRILYSGKPNRILESELHAENVEMHTLLCESDFVSLHVPLRNSTYHLIGKEEFALMKASAYLINTARGPVVDEQALINALKEKRIAGAGLDVYEYEPKLTPGLTELDNVVLAPHIGSASIETRSIMAVMAVKNCLNILRGKPCKNRVI